jgi:hypothetical protein
MTEAALVTIMEFPDVTLDETGVGTFFLLRSLSAYSFQFQPADRTASVLPVPFDQISEIILRDLSATDRILVLRIILTDASRLPRLRFDPFSYIHLSHMFDFLHLKGIIDSRPDAPNRFSIRRKPVGDIGDLFGYIRPSTLSPQSATKLSMHTAVLERLNFQPLLLKHQLITKSKFDSIILHSTAGRTPEAIFNRLHSTIYNCGLTEELRPFVWAKLLHSVPYSDEETDITNFLNRKLIRYRRLYELFETLTPTQRQKSAQLIDLQKVVDADVHRNDREVEQFRDETGPSLSVIKRVVRAYGFFNRDTGYVQGMTDLASPFVLIYVQKWEDPDHAVMYNGKIFTREEVESFVFSSFVTLLKITHHERLFRDLGAGQDFLCQRVVQIAAAVHPQVGVLMSSPELEGLTFMFRPLLLLFKREFKNPADVYRLWDSMLTAEQPHCFVRFVAAAICVLSYPKLVTHSDGSLGAVMTVMDGAMAGYTAAAVLQLTDAVMRELEEKELPAVVDPLPVVEEFLEYRSKYFTLAEFP